MIVYKSVVGSLGLLLRAASELSTESDATIYS